MDDLIITPKTKVAEILDKYPQLEDLLIEIAPKFEKLKNPILRKTIAKVTTLSQAAIVGGVKVEELVSKLRAAIGQESSDTISVEQTSFIVDKPDWFNEDFVVNTIDTREILNRGEHPIHEVLSGIKKLSDQQIIKVIVPFIPAPMIEKTISVNYQHWLVEQTNGEYYLYFKK